MPSKKPIVATDEQLANAFADADARTLLAQAREARLGQDSSIASYDASTLQRFTLGLGVHEVRPRANLLSPRERRRAFDGRAASARRSTSPESRRSAAPDARRLSPTSTSRARCRRFRTIRGATRSGSDSTASIARPTTEDDIIHPLVEVRRGVLHLSHRRLDHLPACRMERRFSCASSRCVREGRIGTRSSDRSGSTSRTGQLVRAAYRMSQPIDLIDDADDGDKPGPLARAFIPHTTGDDRRRRRRIRIVSGPLLVAAHRSRSKAASRWASRDAACASKSTSRTRSVNALDSLPAIRDRRAHPSRRLRRRVRTARRRADASTVPRQRAQRARKSRVRRDRQAFVRAPIATTARCRDGLRSVRHRRARALARRCPKSIFDSGDELFGDAERDALLAKREVDDAADAAWPRLPRISNGSGSSALQSRRGTLESADITEPFAPGISLRFTPRIGTRRSSFNGELAVERSERTRHASRVRAIGASTQRTTGAIRSASAAGLSAFLFGRDEGILLSGDRRRAGGRPSASAAMLDWRDLHRTAERCGRPDERLASACARIGRLRSA